MTAREVVPPPSAPGAAELDARPLAERYRSLFVLGRGGMGSVEAALEVRKGGAKDYERVVALKRLLPERRDARRVEMFLREAKIAKMLDHPNVVRAHAYGEIGGELFLALEYVEGQPLSRVLATAKERGQHVPARLAAHVLAEVCEGLHAAHELRGENGQPLAVVHRDVSPQNVMIGYDGSVRLLDFGIAKIEAESVTKTGEVKGKTAYMSPEQAMGDPLDRRSDLYGVGALLFETIAGRRMWGDGTDMDVIRKLALESPPRLEEAGDVPDSLAALHAKLVAKDRDERPSDAAEVARLLREIAGAREGNVAALGALMTAFADEAREQRARLETAIEDAAPAQAEALRASVLPSETTRDGAPAAEVVEERKRGPLVPLAALGLAAAAVVAWATLRPTSTANATATPSAPPNASASANPNPNPNPNPTANPTASAPASASASPNATPHPHPHPRPTSTNLPSPSSARLPPSAPRPPPSPPPPADVDPTPF